jgi:hypothetical protein
MIILLGLLRFVDCAGLPPTRQSATLNRRDATDANTLVLPGLLAPVVVIAEDKDILASGSPTSSGGTSTA